jgi:hypothetical protein
MHIEVSINRRHVILWNRSKNRLKQSSERGWSLVSHFEGSFSDRSTRGQSWQRM